MLYMCIHEEEFTFGQAVSTNPRTGGLSPSSWLKSVPVQENKAQILDTLNAADCPQECHQGD